MRLGFASAMLSLSICLHPHTAMASCADSERQIASDIRTLPFVADQTGAIQSMGKFAAHALRDCRDSAALWYTVARAAELLDAAQRPPELVALGDPRKIAGDAASHAPRSAAIATVLARVDGSIASARTAYGLDPTYRPAQRVLALALARSGAIDQAQRLLANRPQGSADRIAEARILLIAGHPARAASNAENALAGMAMDTDELTPRQELLRDGNEVLGFALLAQGKTRAAARALHDAAAYGSHAAQTQLNGKCDAAAPSRLGEPSCPTP